MRNKTDIWVEMSIREIWTQCHFAERAYFNIDPKANRATDVVFSSIHSFLSHCAMVSRMLKAKKEKNSLFGNHKWHFGKISLILQIANKNNSTSIGEVLGISENSPIHKRKFRNSIEHYDERLKDWIDEYPPSINVGTYNIGPKSSITRKNFIFVSHYDPINDVFTFVNQDIRLSELKNEVSKIKTLADNWVKSVEFGQIKPPYIK